jgi:hypothetical protein
MKSFGILYYYYSLLFAGAWRASRRVSDMQNVDCVAAHPVKDPKGIADDCDHTNMGALRDARGSFGRSANAVDNIA